MNLVMDKQTFWSTTQVCSNSCFPGVWKCVVPPSCVNGNLLKELARLPTNSPLILVQWGKNQPSQTGQVDPSASQPERMKNEECHMKRKQKKSLIESRNPNTFAAREKPFHCPSSLPTLPRPQQKTETTATELGDLMKICWHHHVESTVS